MVSIELEISKAITAAPLLRKDSTHDFPIPEAAPVINTISPSNS